MARSPRIGLVIYLGVGLAALACCGCRERGGRIGLPSPAGRDPKGGDRQSAPSLPATRPALPDGWIDFRHPDGAFTVYLPGVARPADGTRPGDLSRPSPDGIARSLYEVDHGDLSCALEVNVFPPDQVAAFRLRYMHTNFLLNASPYTWTRRSFLPWLGHETLELVGWNEAVVETVGVARIVFVGNRMYRLGIRGVRDHPTEAERSAFFDSVVLGDGPGGGRR